MYIYIYKREQLVAGVIIAFITVGRAITAGDDLARKCQVPLLIQVPEVGQIHAATI